MARRGFRCRRDRCQTIAVQTVIGDADRVRNPSSESRPNDAHHAVEETDRTYSCSCLRVSSATRRGERTARSSITGVESPSCCVRHAPRVLRLRDVEMQFHFNYCGNSPQEKTIGEPRFRTSIAGPEKVLGCSGGRCAGRLVATHGVFSATASRAVGRPSEAGGTAKRRWPAQ